MKQGESRIAQKDNKQDDEYLLGCDIGRFRYKPPPIYLKIVPVGVCLKILFRLAQAPRHIYKKYQLHNCKNSKYYQGCQLDIKYDRRKILPKNSTHGCSDH